MVKLSANQETLLLVMIDEADRWWTASTAAECWPRPAPKGVVLGMALRGLWIRGLVKRDHGPPSSYRLTPQGRQAAKDL